MPRFRPQSTPLRMPRVSTRARLPQTTDERGRGYHPFPVYTLHHLLYPPAYAGVLSPRIAERRRDRVDGQVDSVAKLLAALAGTNPLQQLDLKQVQGLDVGEPQEDRILERRIALQQPALAGHLQEAIVAALPFLADPAEQVDSGCIVFHQLAVASRNRQVGL